MNTNGTRVRLAVTCGNCSDLIGVYYDKIEEKFHCDNCNNLEYPWKVISTIEVSDAEAKRFKELEEDSEFLNRLRAAGVDNWDGYHYGFGNDDEEDYR